MGKLWPQLNPTTFALRFLSAHSLPPPAIAVRASLGLQTVWFPCPHFLICNLWEDVYRSLSLCQRLHGVNGIGWHLVSEASE